MRLEDVYGFIGMTSETGRRSFTQKEIAVHFDGSLGVVNYALRPLHRIGAIRKKTRGFELIDWRKFLVHWASARRKRTEYSTFSPEPMETIEGLMPPVLFTAYSGAKIYHGIAPSEYSECIVYGDCAGVGKRFPPADGRPNVFCRGMPIFLEGARAVPLTLLYVDLWNLGTWYAREFLNAVEAKLNDVLE